MNLTTWKLLKLWVGLDYVGWKLCQLEPNPTQTSQKNVQSINPQNSTQDVKLGLVLGSDSLGWWVEYTHLIS